VDWFWSLPGLWDGEILIPKGVWCQSEGSVPSNPSPLILIMSPLKCKFPSEAWNGGLVVMATRVWGWGEGTGLPSDPSRPTLGPA
jgi:hypothetical protein